MKPTKTGGFSQLAVWIPTEVKNAIAARAAVEGKEQKEIVERALRAEVEKRAKEHPGK